MQIKGTDWEAQQRYAHAAARLEALHRQADIDRLLRAGRPPRPGLRPRLWAWTRRLLVWLHVIHAPATPPQLGR